MITPRSQIAVLAIAAAGAAMSACHTTPAASSGYLASYEGMAPPKRSLSAANRQRRDDAASDAITAVYLEPAVFTPEVAAGLSPAERAMVLREVERQICFEVSERFAIAPAPGPDHAVLRTAIVRLQPTGRIGSAASAAVGYFVPVINLRAPITTGGLAIESELLEAGSGRQIAALSWARNAQYVGRDSPSLSRVGDAIQMAEPMGDAVGDAFASKARKVMDIPDPDPCAAYGPRRNIGRSAAGFVLSQATGLYSPEVAGVGASAAVQNADAASAPGEQPRP